MTVIQDESGKHFDPDIVEVFLDSREEVMQIKAPVQRRSLAETNGSRRIITSRNFSAEGN